jgi:hypothetical protein
MSNRSQDSLFQLIKSLEKAEKRHFKLYVKRNSSNQELKIIHLFDAIDRQDDYDENAIVKRLPDIQKKQLPNLKAHLYKQILASLRLLKSNESLDLQLTEQFDYAHILYKKGLIQQSLTLLEKCKQIARAHQKHNHLIQALTLEKRIESLYITRSNRARSQTLSRESFEVSNHISVTTALSNLALQLYEYYIRNGHALNEADEKYVMEFMKKHEPKNVWKEQGFYERLFLYQSYTWYHFIRQNLLLFYRYAKKWVDLFEEQPLMKKVETSYYIKGLHYLLNAHFDLRYVGNSASILVKFEEFSLSERVEQNDNFRQQAFFYVTQARINQHFMTGTFREGIKMVPEIEAKLSEYSSFVDRHRVLVLHYKMATLYFGHGDYSSTIDYLQKIINAPDDLRYDLQCYARIMHLLSHYELQNHTLVEHLAKSVYRYMSKMENLTIVEQQILKFLRNSLQLSRHHIKEQLEQLLNSLKEVEKNRFQTRSFAFLDIISWLESKVYKKPMGEIIGEKYRLHLERDKMATSSTRTSRPAPLATL